MGNYYEQFMGDYWGIIYGGWIGYFVIGDPVSRNVGGLNLLQVNSSPLKSIVLNRH